MDNKQFRELSNKAFCDVMQTLDIAYDEYAHKDSQFNNFNQLANLLNQSREQVWAVYFLKHVFGILAYINGTKEQRESIRERIIDCIGYLLLLNGMIEENNGS